MVLLQSARRPWKWEDVPVVKRTWFLGATPKRLVSLLGPPDLRGQKKGTRCVFLPFSSVVSFSRGFPSRGKKKCLYQGTHRRGAAPKTRGICFKWHPTGRGARSSRASVAFRALALGPLGSCGGLGTSNGRRGEVGDGLGEVAWGGGDWGGGEK